MNGASPTNKDRDLRFMQMALGLARRGLGRVAPNPAVGCVIVDSKGKIAGRGHTQPGGRPHAETVALAQAGARARGADVYVTLEPCSHIGKTGPCTDTLITAGARRVISTIQDPDPRVSGEGFRRLREAGVEVIEGVEAESARTLNAGFISRLTLGRPHVTLKLAMSLDGRIATSTGESRWITGEQSRARGHMLRAESDAVLVGSGTARADDPELTCRIAGLEDRSPVRVIVAGAHGFSLTPRLAATAEKADVIVFDSTNHSRNGLERNGIRHVHLVAEEGGRPAIPVVLRALADQGITRLLVEGGSAIAGAFLRAKLVDRLAVFRGAGIIGADGLAAISALGTTAMRDIARFVLESVERLGDDVVETYRAAT